jgi:transglutaminase-like putative cysteine protease
MKKLAVTIACLSILIGAGSRAQASTPDWLRKDAQVTLPAYPAETNAVLLRDENRTVVTDGGEIKTYHRRSIKILRRAGQDYGAVVVHFDNDTRLTYFKAWSITAKGEEYEVKEKEAVESSLYSDSFYSDFRTKTLVAPAAEPGTVIGYEYEQKERPYFYELQWQVQREIPVHYSRFEVQLPQGWDLKSFWQNQRPIEPSKGENRWTWEASEVAAVEKEPDSPTLQALAGMMILNFSPNGESHASWSYIGKWYADLAEPSNATSPELSKKTAELTAASATTLEKIRKIARFAQSEIRYVAIEVGIGSHQPHRAGDILTNRYGDCKDKATLLRTMLKEIGVDSHYILLNASRGVMRDTVPSAMSSNHVILAITLPKDVEASGLLAVIAHPTMGRLLIFDPTDHIVSFGYIPARLQGTHAMLVLPGGGESMRLPVIPARENRIERTVKVRLLPDGGVTASVTEIRHGDPAFQVRASLSGETALARSKAVESYVSKFVGQARVTKAEAVNIESTGDEVRLLYDFRADNYVKRSGELILLRPQIVGESSWTLENKKRQHPFDLESTVWIKNSVEFELPRTVVVDELPAAASLKNDFGEFSSSVTAVGDHLLYLREFSLTAPELDASRAEALRLFLKQVATFDRSSVVLKGGN